MADYIDLRLVRAAIVLAEVLDYSRAAQSLKIAEYDLRRQISDLEDCLCMRLFDSDSNRLRLTKDGDLLIPEMVRACMLLTRGLSAEPDPDPYGIP